MYTEYQRDRHALESSKLPSPNFYPDHQPSQRFSPRSNEVVQQRPSPHRHVHQSGSDRSQPRPQDSLQPHHPHPPSPTSPDTIKCSSCSSWVHLDDLGDHVCRRHNVETRALRTLRVDVSAAEAKPLGQHVPLRSPMYPGHLEPTPPHTPGSSYRSRPTSPALSARSEHDPRSASSNSSASSSLASASSSSRMPFFERYNKLVGSGSASGNGGAVLNMAGVGMRNLDLHTLPSHAAGSNTGARTPSPVSPYFAPPYGDNSHNPGTVPRDAFQPMSHQTKHDRPPPNQPLPLQSRPEHRTSRTLDGHARRTRPALSDERSLLDDVLPSDAPVANGTSSISSSFSPAPHGRAEPVSPHPPEAARPDILSQSLSDSSSIHSTDSAYIAYNRRETLKPAPVDPGLPPPTASGSRIGGEGSISSLDALEDLLLMAREEAQDDQDQDPEEDGSLHKQAPPDGRFAPQMAGSRIPSSKSVPSFVPLTGPDLSASGTGMTTSESTPELKTILNNRPTKFECTTCQRRLKPSQIQKAGDGQLFCRECYAERYLPKCRKCEKAIEGAAVTSSDGKVLGKYHPACFSCFACSTSFPSGDFYVFSGKPYCQYDYHRLNGSLCANKACGTPIEGPCVSLVGEENGDGGRYHPNCFVCSVETCSTPLLEHHFVVDHRPYCETHSVTSRQPNQCRDMGSSGSATSTSRAKRRQTIITRR